MGYYVNINQEVNIYVEDLNPKSQKAILFYTAGLQILICLNISSINFLVGFSHWNRYEGFWKLK